MHFSPPLLSRGSPWWFNCSSFSDTAH